MKEDFWAFISYAMGDVLVEELVILIAFSFILTIRSLLDRIRRK